MHSPKTTRIAITSFLILGILFPAIARPIHAQDEKKPNCTFVLQLKPGYKANINGRELQHFQKDGKSYAGFGVPPNPILKGHTIVPFPFTVVSPEGAQREYLLIGIYGTALNVYNLTNEDYLGTSTKNRTQGFLITVSAILDIEFLNSSMNAKRFGSRKLKVFHLSKMTSSRLTTFIDQCRRMDIDPNTLVETKKLAMQFGTLANICAPPESKTEALQKLGGLVLKILTTDFSGKPLGEQASSLLKQCSDQVGMIVLSCKYRSTESDKVVLGRFEPIQQGYAELSEWAEDIYAP